MTEYVFLKHQIEKLSVGEAFSTNVFAAGSTAQVIARSMRRKYPEFRLKCLSLGWFATNYHAMWAYSDRPHNAKKIELITRLA